MPEICVTSCTCVTLEQLCEESESWSSTKLTLRMTRAVAALVGAVCVAALVVPGGIEVATPGACTDMPIAACNCAIRVASICSSSSGDSPCAACVNCASVNCCDELLAAVLACVRFKDGIDGVLMCVDRLDE